MSQVRVVTEDDIKWSDDSLFQGVLVLDTQLPSGYNKLYSRATSQTRRQERPIPRRVAIPIVNGVLQNNQVFPTVNLTPPNTRYKDTWFDSNGKTIWSDSTVFSIPPGEDYVIAVPTLPVPQVFVPTQTQHIRAGWSADLSILETELSASSETNTVIMPTDATGFNYLAFWRSDADGGDPSEVYLSRGGDSRNLFRDATDRTIDEVPGKLIVSVLRQNATLYGGEPARLV